MAAPKVRNTKDNAAAITAPAITAPQSTKRNPACVAEAGPTCTIAEFLLPEAKSAQDQHHDHDQADEIDDAVHGVLLPGDIIPGSERQPTIDVGSSCFFALQCGINPMKIGAPPALSRAGRQGTGNDAFRDSQLRSGGPQADRETSIR
jgi:hypothetical protein